MIHWCYWRVSGLLMHMLIRATYTIISLADVMSRLVNPRQKENEDLLDNLQRFKKERNISKSQLGKPFLDSFIKNTTEYIKQEKDTEIDAAKEALFEDFMTVFFVRDSNLTISEIIFEDFRTIYLMEHNEYSKTVQAAMYFILQMNNTRNNIVSNN